MTDFEKYQRAIVNTKWKRAQFEAASTDFERALMEERMAELLSQHETAATIGVDRERLRSIIKYIKTGRWQHD